MTVTNSSKFTLIEMRWPTLYVPSALSGLTLVTFGATVSAVPFSESETEELPARSASAPSRNVTDQAPWVAGVKKSSAVFEPVSSDSGQISQVTVPPTKLNSESLQALAPRYKTASELVTTRLATSAEPRVRFGVTVPVNTGGV